MLEEYDGKSLATAYFLLFFRINLPKKLKKPFFRSLAEKLLPIGLIYSNDYANLLDYRQEYTQVITKYPELINFDKKNMVMDALLLSQVYVPVSISSADNSLDDVLLIDKKLYVFSSPHEIFSFLMNNSIDMTFGVSQLNIRESIKILRDKNLNSFILFPELIRKKITLSDIDKSFTKGDKDEL